MVEFVWRKGRGCEGKVEWVGNGGGGVGGCGVGGGKGCTTKSELKIWDQLSGTAQTIFRLFYY